MVDPILFSPHQTHQNVREKDAIETLLFMSSPGNSANLKHNFSPSQPGPSRGANVRHALPTSQPRKTLPTHRPHSQQPNKRVGFQKSPGMLSDMDPDDSPQAGGSLHGVGAPRRKVNGGGHVNGLRGSFVLPAGLGAASGKPRPSLKDEDIERMLDRVAAQGEADSSDEEIEIPISRSDRHGIIGL